MDPNTKDWIQSISYGATALALVFSACKFFFFERKKDVQQREDELGQRQTESALREDDMKWRRAEAGKKLVDELLASERCRHARKLIDYPSGREYEIVPRNKVTITEQDCMRALDVNLSDLTLTDHFIRDCFDNFFYHTAILEHWVEQKLVRFDDVKYPVEYYIRALKKNERLWPIAEAYLHAFKFTKAQGFFRRFV